MRWGAETASERLVVSPGREADGILERHLIPAFGKRELSSIEPVDVRQFIASLSAAGKAPRTVRNIYRVLALVLGSAVENMRIVRNPCSRILLPQARMREMVFLSAQEVARLAGAIEEPYGTLVYFAAYTGLRFGEIAALRLGRVNMLRSTVDVLESATEVGGGVQFVSPKNGRNRPWPTSVLRISPSLLWMAAHFAMGGSTRRCTVRRLRKRSSTHDCGSTTCATRAPLSSSPKVPILGPSWSGSDTRRSR